MKRKKMRKIERSTQSSQSDHIPLDLIIKILSKLPAKSQKRFRSVSKLWSSINISSSRPPCVLLIFRKGNKLFVFSSSPRAANYLFTTSIPSDGYLRCFESSVHGLIYLQTSTQDMIWNSTMNRFFTLPKLECKIRRGFLGYDPIDGKYKALSILTDDKIGILTLGDQESWKILSQGFPKHCFMEGYGVCINGVIYYAGSFGFLMKPAIMSFDLRSEKFSLINYPTKSCSYFIASYQGRLALVMSSMGYGVDLWVLEDAENRQWIRKHFPSPPARYRDWKFNGVTDAGEFIYISRGQSLYDRFRIVYSDPKRKSYFFRSREFKLGGLADEDLRRLRQGGFDLIKTDHLRVIPNHIECLMSSL